MCSRKKTERSKKFFTDLMAKEHVPTMINPKPCGHLCCCAITGCEEVGLALRLELRQLSPLIILNTRKKTQVGGVMCAMVILKLRTVDQQ